MKDKEEKGKYKDPVCGMIISRLTAPETSWYNGKTYYFCADACREKFEANPKKYTGKWPRKKQ